MPSARDLRRRIKSIKSTQQITKAMKMVAAAKLRRAQEAAESARPFALKIKDVLSRVAAASGGASHPLLEVREIKRSAYIVITADRGLCGGFNANVLRRAANEVKESANPAIVAVGRKSRDYFSRRGFDVAASYVRLGETIQFSQAKEIAKFVMDKYISGEFDEVYLIFSEFINVLSQRPTKVKLLPVETPAEESKGPKVEYIFEPSAESVLASLLPTYVETTVFRAMLEAKAGEQGARMTAMDSATKNAKELIHKLTLSLNRARQAAITKEISEIVGGAAALE
ncbi:ATP synthase F1 subunit gamma [Desulforamulus hydrothermalis]|uniref:ATP synthase gamma chain n=1 Tax=Desulforamulus hydrothermalis Lam5 = DSM 18033 TaxID=1121428 RepID=K8DZF5_9FIRM|nr:ATP synthase F1 subunit gamma [Desulforamulus hydrothermalis]CCO08434.1 ATP synthase gamma chain [Desulforamulus hydrothermalis Lam5 = DSM 18033]SHH15349.1 ATP synthase F1 subcomplex gamma subunit [Desulforamulus hydrothermalis Lam5 = DSM 18033]